VQRAVPAHADTEIAMSKRSKLTADRTQAAEVATLDPEAALAEELASLRGFLERGDLNGAWEFVKELQKRWPDSERVRHYVHVFAPSVARAVPRSKDRSYQREREWLRSHAREYPGCWLAVFEDRLVVADPDLGIVLDTVRQTKGAETALIHFQPRPDQWF
jgi:hypothetical protein